MENAALTSATVCVKPCEDAWLCDDECAHHLVRCQECEHVWDEQARCSHPVR